MIGAATAPRTAGMERLAAFCFLLYLAVLPWSIAAMSIGLAICALATVSTWLANRPSFDPPRRLLLPALGWMAALVVAGLFAEDRAQSLSRVGKGAFPAVAWIAAYHARDPALGRRALRVLLVSAAVAALFGLAFWLLRGGFPERARGPTGHYMTFAGQILLWLPPACAIALTTADRRWRRDALLAAAAGAITLAATFTRSAWIGAFVALATILALRRPRGLLALAAGALVLVLLAPAAYRERLASSFDPAHATNVERRHMWEAGVRMFRDRPLTGLGLQDLHGAYERYRSPAAREPAGHLHSVYIQIAATMGIVGLAAFAALQVGLFRTAAVTRAGSGLGDGWRLGVTAALAGFLVAGLFEWNFGDEELLHLLFVLAGLAWASRGWDAASEPASGATR